ncbi:MAG: GNAT family N-acetyltransferase [Deltaproteobacteria bacterium]|nr:GNAT family N-acetyltransferase [Deltaproteobacteria bacterium]
MNQSVSARNDIEIHQGYFPGAIGRIVELHGIYYQANWGFGSFFEAKVAGELAEFLNRFDEKHDGFWTALLDDRIEGSIIIDSIHADCDGAHLRWFIVSEQYQGAGIGSRLIKNAVDFCKNKDYTRMYLWTFEGLHTARHLYEKAGFELAEEHSGTQWGKTVNEQKFMLQLV